MIEILSLDEISDFDKTAMEARLNLVIRSLTEGKCGDEGVEDARSLLLQLARALTPIEGILLK